MSYQKIIKSEMFDTHHHHWDLGNGIYNLSLDENFPPNYFSIGLHPKDITNDFERDLEKIKAISQNEKCVAVGESGLDAFVNVGENLQEKVFEAQILWANEIQKPVIVHCVRRFSQLLKFKKIAKMPMIVHGFHKKKSIADELLEKGFYLSFGKALLYDKNLQNIAITMSLDKIFFETDTEEIGIEEIYHQFAKIRKLSIENLQTQIAENLEKVFSIQLKL